MLYFIKKEKLWYIVNIEKEEVKDIFVDGLLFCL